MWRRFITFALAVLAAACGTGIRPEAPSRYEPVPVRKERSLFWTDEALLDDGAVVSLAKLLATVAPDGHGGRMLDAWFRRFATTAHSERALPAQLMDEVAQAQGPDPSRWDLTALPFKVTGIHNRVDLAELSPAGHCGELRVSLASTHGTVQPLHLLFLFRQPAGEGDVVSGRVSCEGTARRWAELSSLQGEALRQELRERFAEGLTRERFLMAETVELTVSPWEWRQWVFVDASGTLDNPPLFQTADVESLNARGALRDDFLRFVAENAELLNERRVLLPERFRRPSARVAQGAPRTPLSLEGLSPELLSRFPTLRQQIELVGCPACHTADAEFVQTRPDRTVSPFYEKELAARERHLERLARGEAVQAPFGPLQDAPVLPP